MDAKGQKSNYCEFCGEFHDSLHEFTSEVQIGETIPDYEFEAFQNNKVVPMKFSDLRGKWLVVFFYPGDFTFVCPTELEEMADMYEKFQEIGAEVISFSTDTVFAHKAWHEGTPAIGKIKFPMGADPSGKIASAFGTLIDGDDMPLTADEGMSRRGTFIVDAKGVLRTVEIHDNSIGRSAKETLRKIQAAQFVEKNPGQVCPASWEPGEEGLETK